ncbi:MAG TPA: type II toxin-antitoxin system VapC family toxin [Candidatus Paceibacterota bacterium]|jgi:predicted nucleic acid-binding protein|nr:type II toxin-antitoxin system VapC family toxin [Candidatus Paceibacterota bacterium]HRT57034.1 type II toxin-antitoxin system VapC family toxin [Candidatus Paceibacterota bacterium]
MSEGFVADSSVGVAWAVHAQASNATEKLLDEVAGGIPLIVPSLWPFEVANSLLVLLRRKKILPADRDRALRALIRLPFGVDDEGPRLALGRISELAEHHGLTVYDATYLELAMRRRLPLASCDEALREAAQRCRIRLLL